MRETESIWLKGFSNHYNPDETNLTQWLLRLKGSHICRVNATLSLIIWWSVAGAQVYDMGCHACQGCVERTCLVWYTLQILRDTCNMSFENVFAGSIKHIHESSTDSSSFQQACAACAQPSLEVERIRRHFPCPKELTVPRHVSSPWRVTRTAYASLDPFYMSCLKYESSRT